MRRHPRHDPGGHGQSPRRAALTWWRETGASTDDAFPRGEALQGHNQPLAVATGAPPSQLLSVEETAPQHAAGLRPGLPPKDGWCALRSAPDCSRVLNRLSQQGTSRAPLESLLRLRLRWCRVSTCGARRTGATPRHHDPVGKSPPRGLRADAFHEWRCCEVEARPSFSKGLKHSLVD